MYTELPASEHSHQEQILSRRGKSWRECPPFFGTTELPPKRLHCDKSKIMMHNNNPYQVDPERKKRNEAAAKERAEARAKAALAKQQQLQQQQAISQQARVSSSQAQARMSSVETGITANNSSLPSKKGVSKVTECLRDLVKEDFFPKIDSQGYIHYTPRGLVLNQARTDRTTLTTDGAVSAHIKQFFPSAPLYHLPSAEARALKKKGSALEWTPETRSAAADCFYIMDQTDVLIIWPDLFDRHILRKYSEFRVENNNTKKKPGILTMCPHCKSNKHVKFDCFNVQKWAARPRTIVKSDARTIEAISPRLCCSNPGCSGPKPKTGKDGSLQNSKGQPWDEVQEKARSHTFSVWTKETFSQYPMEVRRKYSRFIVGIGVNDNGTTWASPDLVHDIIDDRTYFADIEAKLESKHQRFSKMAKEAYYDFVEQHGKNPTRQITITEALQQADSRGQSATESELWPDFDESIFRAEFGPPKEDAIETLFWVAFEMVQPYMLRDLHSRLPGKILSWDGTFKQASRTMSDLFDTNHNCLGLVFGEFGHIIAYAFLDNESQENWKRLLYGIRKHCQNAGYSHLMEVRHAYTDLCCEGHEDRTKHWFAKMFPNAQFAPIKDMFHATKMVTDNTRGTSHPLHEDFCRDLSACVLKFTESSIGNAVDELLQEQPSLTREEARRTVLSTKKWKKKMYNYTGPIEEAAEAIVARYQKLKNDDEELKRLAEMEQRGYQTYILKPIRGHRRGTDYEVDNFLKHLRRGCYNDPLTPEQMSYPAKTSKKRKREGKLPDLRRKRGTSGGESMNKQVNKVGAHASRMSAKLSDALVLCRITRLNALKDAETSHETNIMPRTPFWYLEEQLHQRSVSIPHLCNKSPSEKFPATDFAEEPLGLEFMRYTKWDEIEPLLFCQPVVEQNEATNTSNNSFLESPIQVSDALQADEVSVAASYHAAVLNPSVAACVLSPVAASVASSLHASPSAVASVASPAAATSVASLAAAASVGSPAVAASLASSTAAPPAAVSSVAPPTCPTLPRFFSAPEGSNFGFSAGATTWNRKEGGGRTAFPFFKQYLREPLSSWQKDLLLSCTLQLHRTLPPSIHTDRSYAKLLVEFWNEHHLRNIQRGGKGYGGLLSEEIAERFVRNMTKNATVGYANRKEPDNLPLLMPMPPSTLASHATMPTMPTLPHDYKSAAVPNDATRLRRKRPPSSSAPLRPLSSFSRDEADKLDSFISAREATDYLKEIGGGNPRLKHERIERIRRHLYELNGWNKDT